MDDKNNENDFDDVDFEEFDDDFGEDDDLLGDNDIDSDPADLPLEDEEFAADDFDTDSMDEDDDWGDEDSDDVPADPNVKGKKGSSSKLLLPILLLVALGGGGAYYYTQILNKPQGLSGGAQNPANVAEQDMAAPEPDMDIAIPMPSPITEPSQDEFQDAPPAEPTMSLADIEAEFPGQDNTSINEPEMQIEPAPTNQDPNVLTPMPNIASMDENMDQGEAIPNLDEPMLEEPMAMNNDISEPTEMQIMDNNQPEMQITAPEMPEPAPMEDNFASNEPVEPAVQAEPAIDNSNQEVMSDMQEKNDELSDKLSNMENSVEQKDTQISALSKELEDLKKQLAQKEKQIKDSESRIAELEKSVKEQKSAAAVTPSEPKPAPAKTVSSPAPAKTSQPAPTRAAEIAPNWELRSAQPGKAYVAIKGSNNVLVVENGDTLQGIGKIQSISIENSLWVVRGTQGKIVQ